MSSRFTRLTMFALAASVMLAGTTASAADETKQLSCAELRDSALPAPADYVERCEGGVAPATVQPVDTSFVPGDPVFLCSLFSPNTAIARRLLTAPLPTSTYTNIGPCSVAPASIFAMDFDNQAAVLWAIDSVCGATCTGTTYGTIDQATGAFTAVGQITGAPAGANFAGMKFDPTDGTVYIAVITPSAQSQLMSLNLTTGVATAIGPTSASLIIDIGISNAGVIYAHDIGTDRIVTLDKTTGAVTPVGPTGIDANFAQGMDFDASDDTLYLFAITVPGNVGRIGSVNLATGAFTMLSQNGEELEGAIKRATGPCTGPSFAGLTSATNAGTPSCAINLAWSAGTACGPTTLKYNVYRSTTPNTPPSAATLLTSCLTTLTYTDTTAASGVRYYYQVRAEDSLTTGTGPCNSGRTDTNTIERNAVASGPTTVVTDNVESGPAGWDTTGGTGTNAWSIVTTQANSPVSSWFVADPATVSLQPLRRVAAHSYPAGGGTLSWFHRVDTETGFDGYVVEYSLDGGTTWSDILLGQGTVPANPNRFTLNGYNATLSTGFGNPLPGRRAWSGSILAFQEVRVDMTDFGGRAVTIRFLFGSDNSVSAQGVWIDDISFGSASACGASVAVAPFALEVDPVGNRVYQPNETVVVQPSWSNTGGAAVTLTGALTNHTGPTGPTYTIPDSAASYPSIAVGGNASCGSSCYSVANTSTTRPATHWDTTAVETVTPTSATKTWTLHVGDSFTDVAPSSPFYRFIETILHKNVTGGCTGTAYCPASSTTREQMAVFVLVSKEAPGYAPAPCGATPVFADVPVTSPFCRWVEELARRGVVTGCTATTYCPGASATREQMAVFVLRTLDPALNPPNCGTPVFADVPASSPFCKWIEELARRGVVTGCGGGNYCPAADVTREQMSVFLAVTFSISLYGL